MALFAAFVAQASAQGSCSGDADASMLPYSTKWTSTGDAASTTFIMTVRLRLPVSASEYSATTTRLVSYFQKMFCLKSLILISHFLFLSLRRFATLNALPPTPNTASHSNLWLSVPLMSPPTPILPQQIAAPPSLEMLSLL